MIDNQKKYKTFVVYGIRGQWKVWLIALVLLFAGFWTTDLYFHYMAMKDLKLTPEVIDKDGVIIQQTNYACAPASLAMLMKDQGIKVSVYEMAKAAYTGIFGTWSRSIPIAGRKYGFKVEVRYMDFEQIIDTNLPMIIEEKEYKQVHVVYAVPDLASRVLHVKDPSEGFSLLDKNTFYEYFPKKEKKKCFIFNRK
jgi:predicted double-glycine peptidase